MTIPFDRFPEHLRAVEARLQQHLHRAVTKTALEAEGTAKRLLTSRGRTRTGRLRASIRGEARVLPSGDAVELRLSAGGGGGRADVRYARIQEEGGTVRPRGRYLAVPLPGALTASGAIRGEFARPLRQVPDLVLVQRDGGPLVLGRKRGDRFEALFVLKRSVTIRGKRYLRDAIEAARPRLVARIADAVRASFSSGGS